MFCIWISDLKDLCPIKVLNVTFISSVKIFFPCSKNNLLHIISPGIVSWVCSFYPAFRIMCCICSSGIYRSLTCQSLLSYSAASCSLYWKLVDMFVMVKKGFIYLCAQNPHHTYYLNFIF